MATRTQDQKYSLFLSAIKANSFCKQERQNLNLMRATPVGKYIEPQSAKQSAIRLIDCFNKIHTLTADQQNKKSALECLKNGGDCQQLINNYVNYK